MKSNSLLVFALAASISAAGQQLPLYSHLFFGQAMYNPSKSGASGFSELVTLHRQQWQGMEGAPETSALLFNGATNKERIGYSVYAFTDATDIVRRSGVYGHYAYHAQLSENALLSFGLGAGYVNNTFDMASIRVKNEGDPFLFPANTIFGSTVRDKNSFSLVSCVVSPGFNFNDFQLFERNELLEKHTLFIEKFLTKILSKKNREGNIFFKFEDLFL
jgi:type IX secretion system PorP/SprF family membrane protein